MWPFSKKKTLREYLDETKTVKIKGILFEIKRIDVVNFMQGAKVLLASYATYEDKKKEDQIADSAKKVREYYKDVVLSGVVKPELTRNPDKEPTKINIDDVLVDMSLTEKLVQEIIVFSKKK